MTEELSEETAQEEVSVEISAEAVAETVEAEDAAEEDIAAECETSTDGSFEYTIDGTRATITKYKGSDPVLNISKVDGYYTVTKIAASAFQDNTTLTSVTLPDSVETIGNYAFKGCSNLASVKLPEDLTAFGYGAFEDCVALTEITIPKNLTTVEKYSDASDLQYNRNLFGGCTRLTKAVFEEGTTKIPDYIFRGCPALAEVEIPDRVTAIGYRAFFGCGDLLEITIPRAVTSIGNNAFTNTDKMTVYGAAGTYAQTWAASVGATFVEVDLPEPPTPTPTPTPTPNPNDPTNPSNPTNPTDPTNPNNPTNPTNPTQPGGNTQVTTPMPTPTPTPVTVVKKDAVPGATKVGGEWIAAKQPKAQITKVTGAKLSVTFKWKKVSSVRGYQTQAATDKKFRKNVKLSPIIKQKKTSYTMKGLKPKKKYYVRIRTVKTVKVKGKSVKVYSKWSKAKTIKTK